MSEVKKWHNNNHSKNVGNQMKATSKNHSYHKVQLLRPYSLQLFPWCAELCHVMLCYAFLSKLAARMHASQILASQKHASRTLASQIHASRTLASRTLASRTPASFGSWVFGSRVFGSWVFGSRVSGSWSLGRGFLGRGFLGRVCSGGGLFLLCGICRWPPWPARGS